MNLRGENGMKLRLTLSVILLAFLLSHVCSGETLSRPLEGLPVRASGLENPLLSRKATIQEEMPLQEGPIDAKAYVVGPGDIFAVDIWGKASLQLRLEVDTEGKIFVPDSGSLLVGGRSLEEARRLIESVILSAVPQGNVEVRLVSLRKFKVYVSGEIESPGSYVAAQVTRVSEVLSTAARDTLGLKLKQAFSFVNISASDTVEPRLNETSSFRNIELRHPNGETERVDLVLFYVSGDLSHNPRVRDGDVIYVPRLEHFFSVSGAVMFPGTYELVEGEKLSQVLRLVGGVTPEADLEKGEIRRFVSGDKTESTYFNVESVIRGATDFEIVDGDRIYVRSPGHYLEHHQVLVRGEVLFPGWYAINPGEDKLSEIVARAGGFTAEADLSGGRVTRPHSLASREQGKVQCDMVKLFLEKRAEADIRLQSGDIVEIPKTVGYVYVAGEVRRPGYVRYVPNKRAGFYLHQAGGFTSKAEGRKTLVKRLSTGQSLSPREAGIVLPNDSINVPARMEGARWALIKDTVYMLAQMATIYIVIDQATK
jgi:protein involved in polysaccharide export with SLBB domain